VPPRPLRDARTSPRGGRPRGSGALVGLWLFLEAIGFVPPAVDRPAVDQDDARARIRAGDPGRPLRALTTVRDPSSS